MAGTIAAKANNGIGVAGVAFNADLVICKALGGPLGTGSTADVANCINWVASQGAKVISMSLGGGASTTLQNAVANAWNNGNGVADRRGRRQRRRRHAQLPGRLPEVVSVAATDNRDARASFSNANADVEIAAPGVNVLSTVRGGGYADAARARRWPRRTWRPSPACCGSCSRRTTPRRSAAALDAAVNDLGPAGRDRASASAA